MEETFTREELINSLEKYWIKIKNNPDDFKLVVEDSSSDCFHTDAIDTIDEIIDIILSERHGSPARCGKQICWPM